MHTILHWKISSRHSPLPAHNRAYLRHLMAAQEPLAALLNTLHNLAFYLETMRKVREEIAGA